jgi:hypothetical protein
VRASGRFIGNGGFGAVALIDDYSQHGATAGGGRTISLASRRRFCATRHRRQLRDPQKFGVQKWLARHPRWTFHFTPTSASWLNAVEGFFAKLARRRLKRGVFLSVVDLQAAINRFVVEHNAQPKPFTWTADPDKIIRAVRRGYQVLDSIH